MDFTFTVTVTVERTEGKFASRDDIEAQLTEALEGADPGSIDGENEGTYETTEWTVEAQPQPKRERRRRTAS